VSLPGYRYSTGIPGMSALASSGYGGGTPSDMPLWMLEHASKELYTPAIIKTKHR